MNRRDYEHISGCLLGGAVGDALGAPVEFMSLEQIRSEYGPRGIENYSVAYGRLGAITDDTQMTLFTLEGLLRAIMRREDRGICNVPMVVWHAYLRWLGTQGEVIEDEEFPSIHNGWLLEHKELHLRRAPGNSCLSALRRGHYGTIEKPINDSKGCGGVMRMAPVGLVANEPFRLGCELAAITHGHPSGYLASGAFAQIIAEIMDGAELIAAIGNARDILRTCDGHEECLDAIDGALALVNEDATPENVEKLGQGWVAEEALAISLFCALKAMDFAHGIRLAVNHGGDSDSTGAVTGNILGALWGRSATPDVFLAELELREAIEEMAADVVALVYADDTARSEALDLEGYWTKFPSY